MSETRQRHFRLNFSLSFDTNKMNLIPSDLIQNEICKYLDLQILIRARGVCREWRFAIDNSSAISDTRRGLLNIYLKLIENSAFFESRHLYSDLEPLDREGHLGLLNLIKDDGSEEIPEQYQIWVREWPEKAIFDDVWPHLKRWCCSSNTTAKYNFWFGAYEFRSDLGTEHEICLLQNSENFGRIFVSGSEYAKNWVEYLEKIAEKFAVNTYCDCSEKREPKYRMLSWDDIRDYNARRRQSNQDAGAAHINQYESNIDKIYYCL